MRKHSHYFKDVSKLGEIDVYRVCDLFQINDPSGATQHALKKILLPGLRGGKCTRQDMQEAIDTLTRRIQMLDEDAAHLLPGMGSMGIPIDLCYPAREKEGPDVSFDGDSPRMQAIAQNGNDGAHYSEIDRLRAAADFNDDVPVQGDCSLPGGYSWADAPSAFNKMGRTPAGSLVWYNDDRYRYVVCDSEHPFCKDERGDTHSLNCIDYIAERPAMVKPQRPRHVCPACGLGHSISQCNPMTAAEAVELGGKPINEWKLIDTDVLVNIQPGARYDVRFEAGHIARNVGFRFLCGNMAGMKLYRVHVPGETDQ